MNGSHDKRFTAPQLAYFAAVVLDDCSDEAWEVRAKAIDMMAADNGADCNHAINLMAFATEFRIMARQLYWGVQYAQNEKAAREAVAAYDAQYA